MFKKFNLNEFGVNFNIESFIKNSLKITQINWFDLPDTYRLLLGSFPKNIKKFGNFITVKRLKSEFGKDLKINNLVIGIKRYMVGSNYLKISFPIQLHNKYFIKLYSLMISEGSTKTEFSLNVPENFFHEMFRDSISKLISNHFAAGIRIDSNNNVKRSRAPAILRNILPINDNFPSFIFYDKNMAREYLRVAFEAEGSPILNVKQYKRYIKISRYCNITNFIKEKLPLKKRIFINELSKKYPKLYNIIRNHPPRVLLAEHILLKKHFGIESKLQLEAIRKNKTPFRAGKITARWILFIYANNINKFIKKIGFISKKKKEICWKMMSIGPNKPQYSTLDVFNKIKKKSSFTRKDFIVEMKKRGYKSPSCYLWRYCKKGLIKMIKPGYFKVIY